MLFQARTYSQTQESIKTHTPSQARSLGRPVGKSRKRPLELDVVTRNFDVSAGTKSISDL